MKRLHLYILIIGVLLTACSKKIKIPLPDEPVKPVLNAFLSQDSLVWASVSLSGRYDYFDTSGGNQYPDEAVVKLYEGGNYIETLHDTMIYSKKYYISRATVSADKNYRLTLEVKGYDQVEGTDLVPDRDELQLSDKSMYLTPNEYGDYDYHFNFNIRNTGQVARYYKFRMHVVSSSYYIETNGDTTFFRNNYLVNLSAPTSSLSFFSGSYVDPVLGGVYAAAPLQPGVQENYALEVTDYTSFGGGNMETADSFYLEVVHLTTDAYRYLYTYTNVLRNQDDPTAEKQNVICNVKNGYGIVGGMAVREELFHR